MKQRMYLACLVMLSVFALPRQAQAQKVPIVKWDWLESKLKQETDTVYVINFWATWCKPCVEEMPDLLKANKSFKDQPVKFIFISLDFKQDAEKRVDPFIRKRRMTDAVLLDEPDYNKWLAKVDKSWQGNIPATLLLRNAKKKRIFIANELKEGEAEANVQKLLNLN